MAQLVLTTLANADDLGIADAEASNPMSVGGVTTTPIAGHGQGWRFDGVTLTGADTISSAVLSLMKNGTLFSLQENRWTVEDSDDAAQFSTSSPTRPGDRAILTPIGDSQDSNQTDGTRYDFPYAGADQTTLGARIATVLDRAGWASGNAIAILNNSDQDASAVQSFARKNFHDHNSATANSEPTLTITYTAAAATLALVGRTVLDYD